MGDPHSDPFEFEAASWSRTVELSAAQTRWSPIGLCVPTLRVARTTPELLASQSPSLRDSFDHRPPAFGAGRHCAARARRINVALNRADKLREFGSVNQDQVLSRGPAPGVLGEGARGDENRSVGMFIGDRAPKLTHLGQFHLPHLPVLCLDQ